MFGRAVLKEMMHTKLGYKLLYAERNCLEKHVIWALSRWRVYGNDTDFRAAMVSLDELALLKSLDSMCSDLASS